MIRKTADAPFERMPLVREHGNKYEGMLFDLAGPLDYFVEADGVRSTTYTLKVVDLPYVQKLELEYHFPAYTGLAPRKIEDGGDIAVLRGTEVRVTVMPTMTAKGGQIVLHDNGCRGSHGGWRRLVDGELQGGQGRVLPRRARCADGRAGDGVAAVHDRRADRSAAVVSIAKPGRDTTRLADRRSVRRGAAEDDFGVKDLELVYSVNGGAEKTLRLFDGKNRLAEVTRRPHVLSRRARRAAGRLRVVLRARRRQRRRRRRQAGDERHLLPADPAAEEGLQARRIAGRRRRRRRRRRPGRRALAAAAPDHRRDVQRQPRSQDDDRREAEGELGGRGAVAGSSCASRSTAC